MLTDSTVEAWLREDVGHRDVTNDVSGETTGRLLAREAGVAAGLEAAVATFEYLGVEASPTVAEGDRVEAGDVVLRAEGPAREMLRGERVAVNVAGHASGVATKTRRAVEIAAEAGDARVAATRKTTPGLRGIEKRAVAAGGGDTHRLDLSGMVMVKDNHVAEMGLEAAVERFRRRASFATKLEVEIENPADAARAARTAADIVLLDNMSPDETAEAVAAVHEGDERVLTEASGGITTETLPEYATTGVDVVSMGSLTHSAPSLDFSFRTG